MAKRMYYFLQNASGILFSCVIVSIMAINMLRTWQNSPRLETTFSKQISWEKMVTFWFKYQWGLFIVLWTTSHHWFRYRTKPLPEPMMAKSMLLYANTGHSLLNCSRPNVQKSISILFKLIGLSYQQCISMLLRFVSKSVWMKSWWNKTAIV